MDSKTSKEIDIPKSIEIEEAILGSLILEGGAYDKISDILPLEAFYKEEHKAIYRAIQELDKAGAAIDAFTIGNQLKKANQFDNIGGYSGLIKFTSRVSSAASIEWHCRIVLQYFMRRKLIDLSKEISRDAHDPYLDVFELYEEADQKIQKVLTDVVKIKPATTYEYMLKGLIALKKRGESANGITGVGSGYAMLDKITGGWQDTDFIVVAARPSMGKTAFALKLVRNAAVMFKKKVAVFSLEMPTEKLIIRMLGTESGVDANTMRTGKLSNYEWEALRGSVQSLANAPIVFDDASPMTVDEIRSKAKRIQQESGLDLIIIDYLQLIKLTLGISNKNREQEVSTISNRLKAMAKELKVPVIALSQLSRATETRTHGKKETLKGRPILSDIRESGGIENDADVICFIHRPEYYGVTEDEDGNSLVGQAEIIIAKQRDGVLGSVFLRFNGSQQDFRDPTLDYVPPPEWGNIPKVPNTEFGYEQEK
jgi:replicative DNA helicase